MSEEISNGNGLKLKVQEWLEKEGYSLEFLTATAFEKQGFRVRQSENYLDEKNNIHREVDVLASLIHKLDDETLFRITHVVECKWSKDKPWVVFCSNGSNLSPAACIAQSVSSKFGNTLLWLMAADRDIYGSSHFLTPNTPGFSGRQALANGKDLFYSAMQNVTAASRLVGNYFDDSITKTPPDYAELVFPVVVVNGSLFQAVYNDECEKIELEETKHIRLHWDGSESSKFPSSVDIITSDYIDEFVTIRRQEARLIFESMEKSYNLVQRCIELKNISPLDNIRASRGFLGIPPMLREIRDQAKLNN
ncbi:hypothetical protein GCM10010912_23020 [Paenibacillus albidus]|uniref:Uncharacterized protein n=1 Tax=Paenibacillus albidus TaxID=2041023 RepID=A0A917FHQ1_9BACL|nr:hypothetical protein [Paenibacillus albidus]GGF77332.1 hypothetical protein GCM10010912_23020 [Paenibacillus albidus]